MNLKKYAYSKMNKMKPGGWQKMFVNYLDLKAPIKRSNGLSA